MKDERGHDVEGQNSPGKVPEIESPRFKITLESVEIPPPHPRSAPHPIPQIVLREDGTDITGEQLPYSIPDSPLHLCPNCDYNLTSLRTRRCPECGELFDLVEAKRRGAMSLPHVQQDIRAIFADNLSLAGGSALFLGSFIGGRWMLSGARGGWGAWLAFIAAVILAVAMMYKVFFQRTLSEAILIAGIVAAATVSMIVIIFH